MENARIAARHLDAIQQASIHRRPYSEILPRVTHNWGTDA